MRTVISDPKNASNPKFNKYLKKYVQKRGYKCPLEELPIEIGGELMAFALMSFAALDINIDEKFKIILKTEEPTEEPLEFIAIKTGKYSLSFDAEDFKKKMEIPENDPTFEALSHPSNWRRLEDGEIFKHPLAEFKEEKIRGKDDVLMNSYALASFIMDTVRNPQDTEDGGVKARNILTRLIFLANPLINANVLIEKIKAGYVREMMEVATMIDSVFEKAKDNPDIFNFR